MRHIHPLDLEQMVTNCKEPSRAVAFAILALAHAQRETAKAIRDLGFGDAATPQGAIELASQHLGLKIDELAAAVRELAPP